MSQGLLGRVGWGHGLARVWVGGKRSLVWDGSCDRYCMWESDVVLWEWG